MTDSVEPPSEVRASISIEEVASGPLRESPILVYVLGCGTFGLYLPYWIYRSCKASSKESILQSHPLALALASLTPFMAALSLFQILEEFQSASPGRSPSARASGLMPGVLLGLALLVSFSPLHVLMTPGWLLFPIPFAFAQAAINRGRLVQEGPRSTGKRVLHVLIATIGIGCLALVIWRVDVPVGRSQFSTPLIMSERVDSYDGWFSIRSPGNGWKRLEAGSIGDDDARLELASPDQTSWIIAYTADRSQTIATMAAARRSTITEELQVRKSSERRFFWDAELLNVASSAEFEVGDGRILNGHYVVLILERGERLLELIGYTSRRPDDRPDIGSALMSLEFDDD